MNVRRIMSMIVFSLLAPGGGYADMPDLGDFLLVGAYSGVARYNALSQNPVTVAVSGLGRTSRIRAADLSPDRTRLVLAGSFGKRPPLMVFDSATLDPVDMSLPSMPRPAKDYGLLWPEAVMWHGQRTVYYFDENYDLLQPPLRGVVVDLEKDRILPLAEGRDLALQPDCWFPDPERRQVLVDLGDRVELLWMHDASPIRTWDKRAPDGRAATAPYGDAIRIDWDRGVAEVVFSTHDVGGDRRFWRLRLELAEEAAPPCVPAQSPWPAEAERRGSRLRSVLEAYCAAAGCPPGASLPILTEVLAAALPRMTEERLGMIGASPDLAYLDPTARFLFLGKRREDSERDRDVTDLQILDLEGHTELVSVTFDDFLVAVLFP